MVAGDRQSGRRDDQEAEPELRPHRQLDVARSVSRFGDAVQLRLSADRRSVEAPAGRGRRPDFRRAALFDARLARSGQTGQSRRDRGRRSERHRRANVQVAAGKIGQSPAPPGTPFELQVNAAGRLSDASEFSNIIVRANPASGAVVRLRDIARMELGALQYSSSAFFGKDPTVVLAIFQMPGSNALDLQRRVKERTEELSKRFPHGIAYAMHYDTTRFVSAAMHDVVVTLSEALLLVVFVVFVFLQSRRTTIIPTIAIPVSLVATLAVMEVLGFSLNMLSLLGMVLAIGLVVENVERQLEAGLPPLSRLAVRQRFQPFRPYLSRDAASRQGFAGGGFRLEQALCAQRYRRHDAAQRASVPTLTLVALSPLSRGDRRLGRSKRTAWVRHCGAPSRLRLRS